MNKMMLGRSFNKLSGIVFACVEELDQIVLEAPVLCRSQVQWKMFLTLKRSQMFHQFFSFSFYPFPEGIVQANCIKLPMACGIKSQHSLEYFHLYNPDEFTVNHLVKILLDFCATSLNCFIPFKVKETNGHILHLSKLHENPWNYILARLTRMSVLPSRDILCCPLHSMFTQFKEEIH